MKRNKKLLPLVLLLALGAPATRADCLGMALHAHRGSHDAPENSSRAVLRAFEGRWDGAEIDIQRLGDQAWILHHDPVLGRTTTLQKRRSANIDSATWSEIRLRNRKGGVSTERAPFLADVLDAVEADDGKVLNVEIKEFNNDCRAAQDAARLLGERRPNGQWFLTSIDRAQLQCVRQVDRRGYVGQILLDAKSLLRQGGFGQAGRRVVQKSPDAAWLERLKQDVGAPVGVHVDAAMLAADPALLERARAAGVAIFTFSLSGDREHVQALRNAAARTRLLPSGAVIDGAADQFCQALGPL
jgi:glycerophosphoryl diester phosphodiesterase